MRFALTPSKILFSACLAFVAGIFIFTVIVPQHPPANTSKSQANSFLLPVRDSMRRVIIEHIPQPQDGLVTAMLLGDESRMSREFKSTLNRTGLRHIIAISGQHVVILVNMLVPFLLWFGLWRKQAVAIAGGIMVFFILLTGLEPSAIRAGIMGGLLLFSQYIGRFDSSLRALVFAAAVMLAIDPFLLGFSIGFQLSFLATLGIIVLLSRMKKLLRFLPEALGIREMLAMNFSAQLFTLPVIVLNFGTFSLVSPITNILVLPVVPFLLGAGLIFLLLGLVVPPAALLLSFPIAFLSWYFTFIAGIFDI